MGSTEGASRATRTVRARLHLLASGLLGLMAISHGLGTGNAVTRLRAAGIEASFERALTVLWLNGAVVPALLAVILLVSTLRSDGDVLIWVVAGVTAVQALAAAYVAGPGFFGVWVVAGAAAVIVIGLLWPGPDRG